MVTDYVAVPPEVMKEQGGVTVSIDLMHIKKLVFVVRKQQLIRFTM